MSTPPNNVCNRLDHEPLLEATEPAEGELYRPFISLRQRSAYRGYALLVEASPSDPATLVSITVLLALVAIVAMVARASRDSTDPVSALRCE